MSDEPVPVPETPPIDWDAIATRLDELFTADCDAYATACLVLFGEPTKERRELFKMVFRRVFKLRAPSLIAANFIYMECLQDELRERGLHTEIHQAIKAALDSLHERTDP